MRLAAQLMLLPFSLFLPMAFRWGLKSALLRLGLLLLLVWYGVGLWQAYPEYHHTVLGWLVLAGVIVGVRPAFRRGGGRGYGVGRGGGGVGRAPMVPRRGGGMVVGPRPFDAGGAVVVVAGRGGRAVRGVAGRLGRGTRRLEVVGGTAVGNVAEGRVPWRARPVLGYLTVGAWLERQPWLRNRRAVDELRGDVDGQPGWAPTWLPGERRPGWREVADELHRDVERRRP